MLWLVHQQRTKLSLLLDSIAPFLSGNQPRVSYQQLCQICRRLVLQSDSKAEEIYGRVLTELEISVASLAREMRGSIMSREKDWLGRLTHGWKIWEKRVVRGRHAPPRHARADDDRRNCWPRYLSI